MKLKAFFFIFKGLSMKQITQIFLEGESPTLSQLSTSYVHINRGISSLCIYYR